RQSQRYGHVQRGHSVGFAVALNLSPYKRERLEEKLSWRINRSGQPGAEARMHSREAMSQAAKLQFKDGREIPCRVIDMSLGGISVETAEWPAIGEEVLIGKMRGRVVRHHETGLGIQFSDVPPSRGSLSQQLVSAA
ncbi:MAG TPA: pilus assembly protein PilZ, partial [Alphaproteobacteria bacterium]|nr:pilus assembly protein PilZ [Alphaproteobacteria bacterium]